jgi:ribosomal protein RSM22 (predicted rRNA methylase)
MVIVEPGTMKGFSLLLALRDEMIGLGGHIIAPCPHHNACPMAPIAVDEASGDRCHFAARCERTALHRRLKSGALGYVDCSFVIARSSRPSTMTNDK